MLEPGKLFGGDADSALSASEPASDAEFGENNLPEWLRVTNGGVVEHAAFDAERDDSYSPSLDNAGSTGGLVEGYVLARLWIDRGSSWMQNLYNNSGNKVFGVRFLGTVAHLRCRR